MKIRKLIHIDEAHKLLMNMAQTFHNICEKYDIPYYMLGGTQLGAVRHKGFIPWDDDMDFGVPREHFERLKSVLQQELQFPFNVISLENTDNYYEGFIKIEDVRTIIEFDEQSEYECGINIDIFPLDKTRGSKWIGSKNHKIQILRKVQNYRFLNMSKSTLFRRAISQILKFVFHSLDKTVIPRLINEKLLEHNGNYYANHYGAWGLREIVELCCFGEPQLYAFEDTYLWGVENYDIYLSQLYGDYMQIPSKNKRHVHAINMYYR